MRLSCHQSRTDDKMALETTTHGYKAAVESQQFQINAGPIFDLLLLGLGVNV